ncbi:hypothetical protein QTL95_17060 [Rhizobium sp. S152]|uniref:hypothetical protein n=1 Tax=Rhizobium sp. S152 TaxID=3055038 RepID=UPI0025A99010|nr:hypothetical protein [Rhizobium sp. S152]MDM9627614.1 hypothetical protein [Rhizobium sp. S152]
MLYVFVALCALACSFLVGRYFAAKTRLVEQTIDDTITRRLAASPVMLELGRITEENGVLRNLLIDIVENEASLSKSAQMTEEERVRATNARTARRRELFGEALLALKRPGVISSSDNLKIITGGVSKEI